MQPDHVDDLIPPELTVEVEPFSLEQLDEFLESWSETPPDEVTPDDEPAGPVATFVRDGIVDDDLAEWAMAHVAAIAANAKLLTEQTKARLDRIQRHHDAAAKRLEQRRAFFEAALIAYGQRFRARDPKHNKTLHLPSGTVKSTASQPAVEVEPDRAEELIAWADGRYRDAPETLAEIVQTTRKPMVSALRKVATIQRVQVGVALTLECGHHHVAQTVTDDGELVATPATVLCEACDPDPITGPPERTVTEVEPLLETMACDADGLPIPGTQVRPASVSYKVAPS